MSRFLLILSPILLFVWTVLPAQFVEKYESLYHVDVIDMGIPTDLDGDGDIDILGHIEAETLGWYENIEDTTAIVFHPINTTLNGDIPLFGVYDLRITAMATVDIDNDDDLDIFTGKTMWYADTTFYSWGYTLDYQYLYVLEWLENDGFQNFGGLQLIDEGQQITDIRTMDVNGDGFQDLVTTSNPNKMIRWYENNGSGGFHPPKTIYDLAKNVNDIEVADIDLDGHIDIVAGLGYGGNRIFWFKNDGLGNFGEPITISNEANDVLDIALADLDNDDRLDVISLSLRDTKLAWYKNVPDDNFGEQQIINKYIDQPQRYQLEVMDFDQDGDNDIFSSTGGDLGLALFRNDGEGNFKSTFSNTGSLSTNVLPFLVDWDTDGYMDFVGVKNHSISWRKNKGDDSFFYPEALRTKLAHCREFVVADITNDGKEDVVLRNDYSIIYLEGTDNEEYIHLHLVKEELKIISKMLVSDLDEDGDLDILITKSGTCTLVWYENQGEGSFSDSKIIGCIPLDDNDDSNVLLGDIDGDGRTDIYHSNSWNNIHAWYRNEGEGNFSEANPIEPNTGGFNLGKAFLDDYDGDNDLDLLLIFEVGDPTLSWYANDGTGNFEWAENIPTKVSDPEDVQLFDVNNDGTKDLFTVDAWYERTGEETYIRHPLHLAPYTESETLIGDINSDGNLDVLTHQNNNYPYLKSQKCFLNNEHGQLGLQYTEHTTLQLTGHQLIDLNGDALLDLVGIRNGEFGWHENTGDFSDKKNQYQINGRQYIDNNENAQFDEGDWGLQLHPLQLLPLNLQGNTYEDGRFLFVVPEGEHQLSTPPNTLWELTTEPASYDIHTIQDNLAERSFDFGFKPARILPRTEPYLSSNPTRCNQKVFYYLNYTNTGTTLAKGNITLEADELMSFIDATPPPDVIEEGKWTWHFSELYPTHTNKIHIQFKMPSQQAIGEMLQTQATVQLFNEDEELVHSKTTHYESQVRCSYDPNDKLARSNLLGQSEFAYLADTILYTVRFQNTGNDTAFNIRIEDILDKKLDWTTFHPITASHDYRTNFNRETGLATFYFDNIMLPDSTIDKKGSNGFVMFGIASLENLEDKIEVDNTASIFFDFNPPIITNTATLTLIEQVETDIEVLENGASIRVFPNPFSDYTTIEVSGLSAKGNYRVEVRDILGRKVRELKIESLSRELGEGKTNLQRGDLESGLYLIRVLTEENRVLGSGKVLVE